VGGDARHTVVRARGLPEADLIQLEGSPGLDCRIRMALKSPRASVPHRAGFRGRSLNVLTPAAVTRQGLRRTGR
jgi:hypothetical protein